MPEIEEETTRKSVLQGKLSSLAIQVGYCKLLNSFLSYCVPLDWLHWIDCRRSYGTDFDNSVLCWQVCYQERTVFGESMQNFVTIPYNTLKGYRPITLCQLYHHRCYCTCHCCSWRIATRDYVGSHIFSEKGLVFYIIRLNSEKCRNFRKLLRMWNRVFNHFYVFLVFNQNVYYF